MKTNLKQKKQDHLLNAKICEMAGLKRCAEEQLFEAFKIHKKQALQSKLK